jgi:hypothetical protein
MDFPLLERRRPFCPFWKIAAIALIPAAAGVTGTAVVILASRAVPVVVNVWPAAEPPPPAPTALPPPREPAPPPPLREPAKTELHADELPGLLTSWDGVAVSTESEDDVIAAWNEHALAISRDGGGEWKRVALKGNHAGCKATIDRAGAIYFLCVNSDPGLGVFPAQGPSRWLSAPQVGGETVWFGSAGKTLVFFGAVRHSTDHVDEKYVVSTDQGKTWHAPPGEMPGLGNFGNRARIERDGTIWQMRGSEAGCGGGGQDRTRGSVTGGEWTALPWPLDAPGAFWLGAGGWAYGRTRCRATDKSAALCAVGPGPETTPVRGPRAAAEETVDVASNGRDTLAVVGKSLYRVRGDKFTRIDSDVPSALADESQMDRHGRLIGLAAGRIVRWSSEGGWRILIPPGSAPSR